MAGKPERCAAPRAHGARGCAGGWRRAAGARLRGPSGRGCASVGEGCWCGSICPWGACVGGRGGWRCWCGSVGPRGACVEEKWGRVAMLVWARRSGGACVGGMGVVMVPVWEC
eukprot:68385-Chlamydomonas_euryale.AAC.1